jgi:hypothetical protein
MKTIEELGSCTQNGEDSELEEVYGQLAAAQAEIQGLKSLLRQSADCLKITCDHFNHYFPEDCNTRKFIAKIWLKSR